MLIAAILVGLAAADPAFATYLVAAVPVVGAFWLIENRLRT